MMMEETFALLHPELKVDFRKIFAGKDFNKIKRELIW